MRIGIYNHWLSTLGGGEKVTAAMAEALSHHYQVDLIGPERVPRSQIEDRINVDLGKVDVKVINIMERTPSFTKEYDLFINATHGAILPTMCKRNILYVYFPIRLVGGSLLKRTLKAFLFRRFRYGHPLEGLYPADRAQGTVLWWTGPYANLRVPLPKSSHPLALELTIRGYRTAHASPARIRLRICGEEVSEALPALSPHDFSRIRIPIPRHGTQQECIEAEIFADTFCPATEGSSTDVRELGVMLGWARSTNGFEPLHWLLSKLIPDVDMRLQNQVELLSGQLHLERYQTICAVSRYTQRWIERYWRRESDLLYPPVDGASGETRAKRNVILSVGRFFDGHHNKKHFEMVKAFQEMCDAGLRGWELILVGGTHGEEIHQTYLERLKQACVGYPISILTDIPFVTIKELYATSALYWHATGYDEDESRVPERLEHFGMATVEAMAAGCVPVVIGKAGQIEIIEDGRSGFLWNTLDDLKRHSLTLIRDERLRRRLAEGAVTRSRDFSRDVFVANVLKTVERTLSKPA
ncbi:MAG: glycosyltransferase [Candidatus Methylomirabilis oxygeniifera]|uniref:Putative Glycosyl transferase n=1 Tax=Methylomirabilis oxygeniifera TaxID=671143 RepID=D5MJ20_METO1|nr:MAG: glycosyltransferase [Candidatus Methylomirabilis oxyfera]CBE67385.1 putative Glycosyl transferase [Candidatus Methylomirabilis oxyfera]